MGFFSKKVKKVRVYKTKNFEKFADKERISDESLRNAVDEIGAGLVEAELGGNVFKKRLAIEGRGKRGGARSIVAYKASERCFFILGFAKSNKGNLSSGDLKILKGFSKKMLNYDENDINNAIKTKEIKEI